MEKIIYTLLIGALGGYAGIKLKIPAGAMIGSMISVAVYNVLSQKGYVPSNFKLIAQIVIGSVIGLNFTLESFIELKKLIIPAIILVVGLTFFSVTLGLILFKITGSNLFKSVAIDLPTALFSAAPGGLTDMVIMSESFGAQTHIVALLHLIRLITVLTVLPFTIKILTSLLS